MDLQTYFYPLTWILIFCVGDVLCKYKTILVFTEREFPTVLDCGIGAWITIHNVIGGYVIPSSECAEERHRSDWFGCVQDPCKGPDDISQFDGCQGDQVCRVNQSTTLRPLQTCAQSNISNILHVKYRCSRDATAYVIVSGTLTFLVVIGFIFLFIKMRQNRFDKRTQR